MSRRQHNNLKNPAATMQRLADLQVEIAKAKVRLAERERRQSLIDKGLDPDENYPTIHDFA